MQAALNDDREQIMSKEKKVKLLVLAGVPLLLILIYFLRHQVMWVGTLFGPCLFHELTGYHCPGCGNTRALRALINLHPIISLRNNPAMILLSLIGAGYYAELAADVCGKKIKLVPRNLYFWVGLLTVMTIFYIVRNFVPVLAPIESSPII